MANKRMSSARSATRIADGLKTSLYTESSVVDAPQSGHGRKYHRADLGRGLLHKLHRSEVYFILVWCEQRFTIRTDNAMI